MSRIFERSATAFHSNFRMFMFRRMRVCFQTFVQSYSEPCTFCDVFRLSNFERTTPFSWFHLRSGHAWLRLGTHPGQLKRFKINLPLPCLTSMTTVRFCWFNNFHVKSVTQIFSFKNLWNFYEKFGTTKSVFDQFWLVDDQFMASGIGSLSTFNVRILSG